MKVVAIRKAKPEGDTKLVAANQKAIDALPPNSGMWRVEGIPGLYVRCRVTSKSFLQQRRVGGVLVKETLGPLTMKQAKERAMRSWGLLRPAAERGAVTLDAAIEAYIENRTAMQKMAAATADLARYNAGRYLETWKRRTLEEIAQDRAGIAALHRRLTDKHGRATCNQVMRLLSAVHNWHRDRVHADLPEWPRKVAEIHSIPARDWAYSEEELKTWWHATKKNEQGKTVHKGVSTLGAIKRMWWLTALLTGARKGSIEALQWTDIDLTRKVIRFSVTKGNRPYSVPMSNVLADLLTKYKGHEDVPASRWVFPSNVLDRDHLKDVKNANEGVGPAHRLRHTFRTTLARLGATTDQSRLLMGHSLGGNDVSSGYITAPLLIESLRPITNAVAEWYTTIIDLEVA